MALRKLAAAAVFVELKHRTSPPVIAMSRILHRDPSPGIRRFSTPAHGPAVLGRNMEQNNINSNGAAEDNLIFVVDRKNNNLSLLSIENKSLQLVVLGSEDEGITTPSKLLWDPATDEVRPIPQFPVNPHLPVEYSLDFLWGVGFDPSSGDCKVVRASHLDYGGREPREFRGELLSVGTGSWKEIEFPYDYEDLFSISKYCILISGFCYWHGYLFDSDCHIIITFDFGRGEFPADHIPFPNEHTHPKMVLAEYHGLLAVILQDYGIYKDSLRVEIWVWSNGDRSWSHLSTFHVPADVDVKEVVGLYNNDKVILLDSKGAILLYDCRTSELESFGVIRDYKHDSKYDSFRVYPYYSKSKPT
ncbi:F-box family protein [Striga asiatica]|uniref:F-box family protein n=1 Tax=Striga asiatica TaxID=4170 RepID=A0A5A7PL77_STRAF|nr:F-box family protein [Striga asiatica]